MAENKQIQYLNKDFAGFKSDLINFAKTYYPNTATDFSLSSPGTMFIEMASYVGDVLSFYLDNQVQENYIQYAKQTNNLFSLAYMLGYRPKVTSPSTVELTFYQQVPAIVSGSVTIPDFSYALKLPPNSTVKATSQGQINFLVGDEVDFSFSSSLDPTQVSVYRIDATTSQPDRFLLTKKRKAISATINSTTLSFSTISQYNTREIIAPNIIEILDVFDNNGNEWYEVDYLAQDVVFDSIKNTNVNDPNFSSDSSDTPYLLKLKQADRRFTTRFTGNNNTLQIQFGSGVVANNDEAIVPNPDNVGLGLPFEKDKLTTAFSPTNFIFTDSYGIAPIGDLRVRYLTGGGISSNVQANTITTLVTTPSFVNSGLDATSAQEMFNSFAVNNLVAADGGGGGDSIEEIRQNSMAQFSSQLRTVTQDDYLVRALSLPSKYGSIAKVHVAPTLLSSAIDTEKSSTLDLYCLAYDNQKSLKTPSTALKNNLKTYLSQYRTIGDSINIKNGYIINIGVDFEIITLPNYNSNQVIATCITALKIYFNIDLWQMNQPIIMRDLYTLLDNVTGVQSVKNIKIINKAGVSNGYSAYGYDIEGATINGVVYPSLDPSIFELKLPNQDIKGRVVSY